MALVATAEAVTVVMAVIGLWWIATHGKGTAPGRLVAWGVMLIVVWVVMAVNNPSDATTVAGATARGVMTAASGLGAFLHAVFGS
jgi:hypothetical protein